MHAMWAALTSSQYGVCVVLAVFFMVVANTCGMSVGSILAASFAAIAALAALLFMVPITGFMWMLFALVFIAMLAAVFVAGAARDKDKPIYVAASVTFYLCIGASMYFTLLL